MKIGFIIFFLIVGLTGLLLALPVGLLISRECLPPGIIIGLYLLIGGIQSLRAAAFIAAQD